MGRTVRRLAPARAKGLRFVEDLSAEYATRDFAHLWFGLLRCFHEQPGRCYGFCRKPLPPRRRLSVDCTRCGRVKFVGNVPAPAVVQTLPVSRPTSDGPIPFASAVQRPSSLRYRSAGPQSAMSRDPFLLPAGRRPCRMKLFRIVPPGPPGSRTVRVRHVLDSPVEYPCGPRPASPGNVTVRSRRLAACSLVLNPNRC